MPHGRGRRSRRGGCRRVRHGGPSTGRPWGRGRLLGRRPCRRSGWCVAGSPAVVGVGLRRHSPWRFVPRPNLPRAARGAARRACCGQLMPLAGIALWALDPRRSILSYAGLIRPRGSLARSPLSSCMHSPLFCPARVGFGDPAIRSRAAASRRRDLRPSPGFVASRLSACQSSSPFPRWLSGCAVVCTVVERGAVRRFRLAGACLRRGRLCSAVHSRFSGVSTLVASHLPGAFASAARVVCPSSLEG